MTLKATIRSAEIRTSKVQFMFTNVTGKAMKSEKCEGGGEKGKTHP